MKGDDASSCVTEDAFVRLCREDRDATTNDDSKEPALPDWGILHGNVGSTWEALRFEKLEVARREMEVLRREVGVG